MRIDKLVAGNAALAAWLANQTLPRRGAAGAGDQVRLVGTRPGGAAAGETADVLSGAAT